MSFRRLLAPSKVSIFEKLSIFYGVFRFFFVDKIEFPAKRTTFAYSTSYIFWKLLIWRFIWAIRKYFFSILFCVTFLLTQWDGYVNSILHGVLRSSGLPYKSSEDPSNVAVASIRQLLLYQIEPCVCWKWCRSTWTIIPWFSLKVVAGGGRRGGESVSRLISFDMPVFNYQACQAKSFRRFHFPHFPHHKEVNWKIFSFVIRNGYMLPTGWTTWTKRTQLLGPLRL